MCVCVCACVCLCVCVSHFNLLNHPNELINILSPFNLYIFNEHLLNEENGHGILCKMPLTEGPVGKAVDMV